MMKREGDTMPSKDSGAGKIAIETGTNRRVDREIIGGTGSKLEEKSKPKRERIFAVPGAVSGDPNAGCKSGGHRFRYPLFVLAVQISKNDGGGTSLFNSDILYPIAEGGVNALRNVPLLRHTNEGHCLVKAGGNRDAVVFDLLHAKQGVSVQFV